MSELAVAVILISIVVGMEALKSWTVSFMRGVRDRGALSWLDFLLKARICFTRSRALIADLRTCLEALSHLRAVFDIFCRHFGKTDDGGQDVVEVMGDASGKRAHGFHLLGLAELLFSLLALLDFMLKRFVSWCLARQSFPARDVRGSRWASLRASSARFRSTISFSRTFKET